MTMCFRRIEINGVRYTHHQAHILFDKMSEEISTLNAEVEARLKQVSDLQGQLSVARKVLNDKVAENEELRKQLAKWKPKRGKGGRFVKP